MADLSGVAAVVTALAAPLAVFFAWLEQHRAAKRKEKQDAADRALARAAQRQRDDEIKKGQEEIHTLVNNKSTTQEQAITALKDVISKERPVPEMPAGEALPGEVTKDGGVVSVGLTPDPPNLVRIEQPSGANVRNIERREKEEKP